MGAWPMEGEPPGLGVLLVAPGAHGDEPVILGCSSGAARLLGTQPSHAVGQSVDRVFTESVVAAAVTRAVARGSRIEMEAAVSRFDANTPGVNPTINVLVAIGGLSAETSLSSILVLVEAEDGPQEGGEHATSREGAPARAVFQQAKDLLQAGADPALSKVLDKAWLSALPHHYRTLAASGGVSVSSVGFCLCSPVPDYPILYASTGFSALYGYSLSEVVGKNARMLQRRDERGPGINKAAAILPTCRSFCCVVQNRTKAGALVRSLLTIEPVLRRGVPAVFVGWQLNLDALAPGTDKCLPPDLLAGGCVIEAAVGRPVNVPMLGKPPLPPGQPPPLPPISATQDPDARANESKTMGEQKMSIVTPTPILEVGRKESAGTREECDDVESHVNPSESATLPGYVGIRHHDSGRPSLRGLQRQVLRTMELTDLEVQQYERMFKTFDKDGSGTIDTDELRDVMNCLGVLVSDEQLVELQMTVDTNRSGEIEFDEFLVLMKQYKESCRFRVLNKSEHTAQHIKDATRSKKILPDARWKWCWDLVVMLVTLYFTVSVLYQAARTQEMTTLRFVLECLLTFLLVADVVMELNTTRAHTRGGTHLVETHPELALLYMSTFQFWADSIGAIPLDIIAWSSGLDTVERYVRYLRLLRLFRLQTLFRILPRGTMPPLFVKFHFHYVPLIRAGFWWTVMVHFLACVRMILAHDVLINVPGQTPRREEESYTTAVYWVLYTITSVGYGDIMVETDLEKVFACFLFILGMVVNGVMVGKLTVIIQKGDVNSERMERMRETLAVIEHFDVPDVLQEEILAFQYHLLANSLSTSYSEVIVGLPQTLKDNLGLYMRIKFISSVGLFADAQEECKVALAQSLQNLLTAPEELVFVAGDPGEEMYFMAHGFADMISQSGRYLGTIKKGVNFGEEALMMDAPRLYSVKALTYCELFVLANGDFLDILKRFPTFKVAVTAEMSRRNKEWRAERQLEQVQLERTSSTLQDDRRMTMMGSMRKPELGGSESSGAASLHAAIQDHPAHLLLAAANDRMYTSPTSGAYTPPAELLPLSPTQHMHESRSQQQLSVQALSPLAPGAPGAGIAVQPLLRDASGPLLRDVANVSDCASDGSSTASEGPLGTTVPLDPPPVRPGSYTTPSKKRRRKVRLKIHRLRTPFSMRCAIQAAVDMGERAMARRQARFMASTQHTLRAFLVRVEEKIDRAVGEGSGLSNRRSSRASMSMYSDRGLVSPQPAPPSFIPGRRVSQVGEGRLGAFEASTPNRGMVRTMPSAMSYRDIRTRDDGDSTGSPHSTRVSHFGGISDRRTSTRVMMHIGDGMRRGRPPASMRQTRINASAAKDDRDDAGSVRSPAIDAIDRDPAALLDKALGLAD
eukprot:Hpha_TRINITY_DN13073_c1_g1::TRINITY_DN13073_c1_g1_i1::g.68727::m.68727